MYTLGQKILFKVIEAACKRDEGLATVYGYSNGPAAPTASPAECVQYFVDSYVNEITIADLHFETTRADYLNTRTMDTIKVLETYDLSYAEIINNMRHAISRAYDIAANNHDRELQDWCLCRLAVIMQNPCLK